MESERDIYHQAAGTVLSLMPRDRPPTLDELRETSAMVAEMYRKKGDGELELVRAGPGWATNSADGRHATISP